MVHDVVLGDDFLLTAPVRNRYLSYCGLLVSLKQSGHSLLTSLINEAFPYAELLLTGCFFLYCTILSKL